MRPQKLLFCICLTLASFCIGRALCSSSRLCRLRRLVAWQAVGDGAVPSRRVRVRRVSVSGAPLGTEKLLAAAGILDSSPGNVRKGSAEEGHVIRLAIGTAAESVSPSKGGGDASAGSDLKGPESVSEITEGTRLVSVKDGGSSESDFDTRHSFPVSDKLGESPLLPELSAISLSVMAALSRLVPFQGKGEAQAYRATSDSLKGKVVVVLGAGLAAAVALTLARAMGARVAVCTSRQMGEAERDAFTRLGGAVLVEDASEGRSFVEVAIEALEGETGTIDSLRGSGGEKCFVLDTVGCEDELQRNLLADRWGEAERGSSECLFRYASVAPAALLSLLDEGLFAPRTLSFLGNALPFLSQSAAAASDGKKKAELSVTGCLALGFALSALSSQSEFVLGRKGKGWEDYWEALNWPREPESLKRCGFRDGGEESEDEEAPEWEGMESVSSSEGGVSRVLSDSFARLPSVACVDDVAREVGRSGCSSAVVMVRADWCKACEKREEDFANLCERLAYRDGRVCLCQVDFEATKGWCKSLGVRALPHFVVFRKPKNGNENAGSFTEAEEGRGVPSQSDTGASVSLEILDSFSTFSKAVLDDRVRTLLAS
uniref:Thioredoxin domain-containing protein n=1 Tax=Chromera velia CCMP2878 TaxID=1169474 RepID=A0A0G4GKD3_9ALVE|eukprot:Cvel_22303.t1-p1 / transcript=Cvel_22303.t1 / gene=Cvel_22303 / organism=Chromera_velia_CCMP2878 / gene_product=hypothetical protein / transcript_product=hypothetical protein / location=Cvel_scaffold2179:2950-4755(-) / protein_length=602 / sequence_SO=supercontig / SO=protein_coding / is_pseudo=false